MNQKYKIVKNLALLHDGGTQQLRLNVVQWPGHPARYDLRVWTNAWPESWIPGKGILLSDYEARILCRALEEDFLLMEMPETKAGQDAEENPQTAQEGLLPEQTENPAGK